MNFYLAVIYGSFGIISLFMAGYWSIVVKQIIPTMLFAVMGFVLLVMGYKVSPFKEEN